MSSLRSLSLSDLSKTVINAVTVPKPMLSFMSHIIRNALRSVSHKPLSPHSPTQKPTVYETGKYDLHGSTYIVQMVETFCWIN